MKTPRHIDLYDATLRDGAQGEGISFSGAGKIRFAQRLDAFGVPYIEGGYAGSNRKDMEFFERIRDVDLKQAKIVAFGSTRRKDVRVQDDPLVEAILAAATSVATIYGKTWDFQVRDVLRTSEAEALAMIYDTVAYLKDNGLQVFFDAEHFFDGFKENPDFAVRALTEAARGGAEAVVLCDTNGGCLPHEIFDIVTQVAGAVPAPLGIHPHNDSDTGVANAIEAVRAGCIQVQGCMNGYGERCGNANLTSIIPALQIKLGCACVPPENLKSLRELSAYVDELVNVRPNPRAPFVGHSAFSHKGGPHVNAVQKNPRTYEHIPPESVGNERHILVSELSGGTNILLKALELGAGGRAASKEMAGEVLAALKELENKGYAFEAADASFRLLIQKVLKEHKAFFELEGFRVIVEKRGPGDACLSEAVVRVRVQGETEHTVAEGSGPVNALDVALRKALARFYPEISKVFLTDYRVRILDPEEATAAKTQVLIESSDGHETWGTVGVSDNIIEASWEALMDSVEYMLFRAEERASEANRRD